MQASICKFCGKQIFWFQLNGRNRPFEDQSGSLPHHCESFKKENITIQQKISHLQEQQQIDHNLIVTLISKLDAFTRKFSS